VSTGAASFGNAFVSRLLDAVVPSSCLVCEEPRRGTGGGGVCARCWHGLPRLDGDACPLCAVPGPHGRCGECRSEPPRVGGAAAFARYEAGTVALVAAYKFHGFDTLAEPMGRRMAETAKDRGLADVDAVVPVPSTRSRNRERGYDPAVLLARSVARSLHRPVESLLRRTRETVAQSRLAAAGRRANVRGAFAARVRARQRTLLLVDDVVTTGATVRAAAEALAAAGATSVRVVSFARTPEPEDVRHPEAR
jgi:ComF family protein